MCVIDINLILVLNLINMYVHIFNAAVRDMAYVCVCANWLTKYA